MYQKEALMFYSRLSSIFIPIIVFFCSSIANTQCRDLHEMLERDNPRVINYLNSLSKSAEGTKIKGLELCDGSNPLSGLKYIEKMKTSDSKQHIFLFTKDNEFCDIKNYMIAIAWVDHGGSPISIPPSPDNISCEGEAAHVLSYDVFTWETIGPDSGVVIISYPNEEWLRTLRRN